MADVTSLPASCIHIRPTALPSRSRPRKNRIRSPPRPHALVVSPLRQPRPPHQPATSLLAQPLTLPCGLRLPNRPVKCPMQETLATTPFFDPPIDKFAHLYARWSAARYSLLITGQVQIDSRYGSLHGDVVCHARSLAPPHVEKWVEWAWIARAGGTPCLVQLAHPGRMSPAGAGDRPRGMGTLCPSSVPVKLGSGWLDEMALNRVLGTPRACTHADIDFLVASWVRGAVLARTAGFAGCQLHGAHGFLLSQFLSPRTNQRTDECGGTPEKRLALLKRLVRAIREVCPPPFCLSVKLNSADYMAEGGLSQEEGLGQVRRLVECGMVDFVEISGGNAEATGSKLHNSFGVKTIDKAPKISESTRIREAYFTEFAEKVQAMKSNVPIQLSGGFRSRTGMADAIDSGVCQLIGLGRTAVLDPDIPQTVLLNTSVPDEEAFAQSHIVRGQWLAKMVPVTVVGVGLAIQFCYWNMRRLGNGLKSSLDASIPFVIFSDIVDTFRSGLSQTMEKLLQSFPLRTRAKSH